MKLEQINSMSLEEVSALQNAVKQLDKFHLLQSNDGLEHVKSVMTQTLQDDQVIKAMSLSGPKARNAIRQKIKDLNSALTPETNEIYDLAVQVLSKPTKE